MKGMLWLNNISPARNLIFKAHIEASETQNKSLNNIGSLDPMVQGRIRQLLADARLEFVFEMTKDFMN